MLLARNAARGGEMCAMQAEMQGWCESRIVAVAQPLLRACEEAVSDDFA